MATPHGSGTLFPSEPSASSEYPAASNSMAFGYSDGSCADSVSMSGTNSAGATRVYGRNPVLFLEYLEKKRKLITSQMDLYACDIESDMNLVKSKMSLSECNLDNSIQLVNASKDAHAEVVREMEYLKTRKDSHYHDCAALMEWGKADRSLETHEFQATIENPTVNKDDYDLVTGELINKDSHPQDVDRQIELLGARKDLLARNLITQVQLLKATNSSCVDDVLIKFTKIFNNIDSFYINITRQCELLESEKGPFAFDFDRQLKLLNSKLALFIDDLYSQQNLLLSYDKSFERGMLEKIEPLNNDMISYLGQDFRLQECFTGVVMLSM